MSTPENVVALGRDMEEAGIRPLSNAEVDTTSRWLVGAAIVFFPPHTACVSSEKTKAGGKRREAAGDPSQAHRQRVTGSHTPVNIVT